MSLEDARLGDVARDVDFVLDFVWGESTARVMELVLRARIDRGRPLTWIEIGSVGGQTAPIPAAILRAANIQLVGSGIGSVPGRAIVKELPTLVREIACGALRIDAKATPLREVERTWQEAANERERVVFLP